MASVLGSFSLMIVLLATTVSCAQIDSSNYDLFYTTSPAPVDWHSHETIKSFVSISNWGCDHPSDTQLGLAESMAKVAKDNHAGFVVSVGDNFAPRGVDSVDDERFQKAFENVFSHDSLQKRWYITVGDQDYKGNVSAQLRYSEQSDRWHFPSPYYSTLFRVAGGKTMQMFFLDTQMMLGFTEEATASQLNWVERALHESDADYLVVVGHVSIITGGKSGDNQLMKKQLKPALQRYHASFYLSGDDQSLQHLSDGGINWWVNGGGCSEGSRKPYSEDLHFSSLSHGFLLHSFSDDGKELTNSFYDDKGNLLYSSTVEARSEKCKNEIHC